ncbi:MAG TPA: 3'-5' exonuclease [Arcobacter sp.]|nr:3'-5' exonuclease [Arcobacter sp.]
MKYTAKLTKKLLHSSITLEEFHTLLEDADTFFDSVELETELLISNGFPIEFIDNRVYLKTNESKIEDQVFCIVDIETNGGNPKKGQIIEIAAIKLKNGKIIDEYESLVYAKTIPDKVQEITGITPRMLDSAPELETVLEEFKIFLEDDVFVAHSVNFDYGFINDSLKLKNMGELCNRKLCTIDLAKRTIASHKYGLSTLKKLLNIESLMHHRAYYDVLSTVSVFNESLRNLDSSIDTTEKLIEFSKKGESLEIKLELPKEQDNNEKCDKTKV